MAYIFQLSVECTYHDKTVKRVMFQSSSAAHVHIRVTKIINISDCLKLQWIPKLLTLDYLLRFPPLDYYLKAGFNKVHLIKWVCAHV